ncbi:unannotated protein [freshwater metagenome]|uniref:Unannotated protein n=1 Tax=freshwater metagenome TaxID=449393 RepID=A0A6J7A6E7_9ZZZZ
MVIFSTLPTAVIEITFIAPRVKSPPTTAAPQLAASCWIPWAKSLIHSIDSLPVSVTATTKYCGVAPIA